MNADYIAYYTGLRTKYADRIAPLEKIAYEECCRFEKNCLPLYPHDTSKWGMHPLTKKQLMAELYFACKKGIPFVEYTVNTLFYHAWKGDNLSLLTGMYYIENNQIPGASCILTMFRKEGYHATFTEQTSKTGLLRIAFSGFV